MTKFNEKDFYRANLKRKKDKNVIVMTFTSLKFNINSFGIISFFLHMKMGMQNASENQWHMKRSHNIASVFTARTGLFKI